MKQPRLLTANGKAKTASPNGGPRSGFEVVDKRGFVRLVGSMATAPQNDAGISDISPRFEERVDGVWQSVSWTTLSQIRRLKTERDRRAFFAVRVGLVRELPGDAHGIVDGEAWCCPRDYDRALDRDQFLAKALKVGLLSIGGRTYRLREIRPDTIQLNRAAGSVNYTREALLESISSGSI
jgi:hypothetical protein